MLPNSDAALMRPKYPVKKGYVAQSDLPFGLNGGVLSRSFTTILLFLLRPFYL
jgi:hypothetical protein